MKIPLTRPGPPRDLREEMGKREPFDRPETEAYLNLVRTAEELSGAFRRLFADHGLSEPLYNALRIVVGHGRDGVPSQTIGRQMISRDPDVTRLVDRLVAAGLVRRRRCPKDRRVVHVIATAAGRATIKRLASPVDRLHREQLAHLGPAKLKRLSRLLFEARHGNPSDEAGPH